MFQRKALLVLVSCTVFAAIISLWLLTDRPAGATHFRPEICVTNHLNWDLCYTTVNEENDVLVGDGLVVTDIFFKGQKVLHDMRIPHVEVVYENRGNVTDHFLDAIDHDCWRSDFSGHFLLACQYTFDGPSGYPECGSYRYQIEFDFRQDGWIFPRLFIYGPGFDDDHTYRALFRWDFDTIDTSNRLDRYEGGWALKSVEGKYPDDFNNSDGFQFGYEWRNYDPTTGLAYYINPNTTDKVSDTEGAPFWGTRWAFGETEGDEGHADIFVNDPPESIDNADIVDWYTGGRDNPACHPPPGPYFTGPDFLTPSVGY